MILFDENNYISAQKSDLLALKCEHCNNCFYKTKREIQQNSSKGTPKYCSKECLYSHNRKRTKVKCAHCEQELEICNCIVKKNNFCNSSCAAYYNNTHKTKGTRHSKLELYIENKLNIIYPQLKIIFNDKTAIKSELDIYIPSLKLAFELNGIFHYESIFGEFKLNNIQKNDTNKFQKCQENGISLCIIDTSSQKYFKE